MPLLTVSHEPDGHEAVEHGAHHSSKEPSPVVSYRKVYRSDLNAEENTWGEERKMEGMNIMRVSSNWGTMRERVDGTLESQGLYWNFNAKKKTCGGKEWKAKE